MSGIVRLDWLIGQAIYALQRACCLIFGADKEYHEVSASHPLHERFMHKGNKDNDEWKLYVT
jgi:hypothetical protein